MSPQIGCGNGRIVTLFALVQFFPTVCFHMPSCMTSTGGCIITLIAECSCLTFLHCAISNVLSSWLPHRIQSHIDCICLTFPHYGFLNVSSNGLVQLMQNHIRCICSTFLHCVFSNVLLVLPITELLPSKVCLFKCASCGRVTLPHCATGGAGK